MWTCTRRWYLDKDGKPTEHEADGVRLLCGESDRISQELAVKLGLAEQDGTPIEPKAKTKREVKTDG